MIDQETIDRADALFRYLRELVALRSKSVRDFDKQVWSLDPSGLEELPGVAVSYRDTYKDGLVDDAPLVSVTKPDFERCPMPPESVVDWLRRGWDLYKSEPSLIKKRETVDYETGEVLETYFDDDEDRVLDYEIWLDDRANWVAKQRLIERSRNLFVELYNLHADLNRDSEIIELMVGNGFVYDRDDDTVQHPILLKGASITFNAEDNLISIIDNDASSELYSLLLRDMDGLNLDHVQALEEEIDDKQYHPFDRNEAAVFLERVAHLLTPKSEFNANYASRFSSPDTKLLLSMRPVFFVRKRLDGTAKAIERILESIEAGGEIPAYLIDIVDGGSDGQIEPEVEESIEEKLAAVGGEDVDILLAKEANREQLEIARRIERHNAVLVQGPPGTGKTHTIANLIGHFLSQGKNILVTSHTKKALSVLKEKLPEGMQGLCVSVLDDSNKDMEKSIDAITEFSGAHTASGLRKQIQKTEQERQAVIESLSETRKKIFATLHSENSALILGGESFSPIEAAKFVNANRTSLDGIIPGKVEVGSVLPLSEAELAELYATNISISAEDERELAIPFILPEEMLDPRDFSKAMEAIDFSQSKIEEALSVRGWTLTTSADPSAPLEINTDLGSITVGQRDAQALSDLLAYVNTYEGTENWRVRAAADGKKGGGYRARWDALFEQIGKTYSISESLVADTLGKRIVVKEGKSVKDMRDDLVKMKSIFQKKGKLSKLDYMFNKGFSAVDENVSINGSSLQNSEDCDLVLRLASLEEERSLCRSYWTELMSDNGAPLFDDLDRTEPERIANNWIDHIEKLLNWYSVERQKLVDLMMAAEIAPVNTLLRESRLDSEEDDIVRTLEAMEDIIPLVCEIALETLEHRKATRIVKAQKHGLIEGGRVRSVLCSDILAALNDKNVEHYAKAYDAYISLQGKTSMAARRRELLSELFAYAKDWSQAIESREGIHGKQNPPSCVGDAWKYKQLEGMLDELCGTPLSKLQSDAVQLSARYRDKTTKLAELKAWHALLEKTEANTSLRQALSGWKITMKRIGKGTGKRAAQMKAQAREEMGKCKNAVPAWIMPIGKALESFDARKGKFDIVIVDEASQSDVTALAITFLAKKVIIVGDDKQVSPMAVGIDDDKVDSLNSMFIKGRIPNAHLFGPRTSLYDIAGTTFQPLMLREHFRCVPQIIGYSNMLSYDFKIKPLREPGSSILLPAVVSHRVNEGMRDGKAKTNVAEAEEIVNLMIACMKQPEYKGKTFGVISMLGGSSQVKAIQQLMFSKISLSEIERRRILVGEAASFQGDERDVIFLSLVDGNDSEGPLRRLSEGYDDATKKRYNVAASRAKDQLWVVHSLDPENDLKSGDVRKGLLEYAANPDAFLEKGEEIERLAESPFEAEVGKALVAKGYRIEQQHEVGSYRLDIVVLGENSRVAVECDGEQWHSGDDKIREDMERQAILERIGWRFVRIRGSEYYRDPEETMERVFAQLTAMGIEPIGAIDETESNRNASELLSRVLLEAQRLRNQDDGGEVEEFSSGEFAEAVILDLHKVANEIVEKAASASGNQDVWEAEDESDEEMASDCGTTTIASGFKPAAEPVEIERSATLPMVEAKAASNPAPSAESKLQIPRPKPIPLPQMGIDFDSLGEVIQKESDSREPLAEKVSAVSVSDQTAPQEESKSQKENINNPLVADLLAAGYECVDKREQGGSLWVLGGSFAGEKIKAIGKRHDTVFLYAKGGGRATGFRPAWYSKIVKKAAEPKNQETPASGKAEPSPATDDLTKKLEELGYEFYDTRAKGGSLRVIAGSEKIFDFKDMERRFGIHFDFRSNGVEADRRACWMARASAPQKAASSKASIKASAAPTVKAAVKSAAQNAKKLNYVEAELVDIDIRDSSLYTNSRYKSEIQRRMEKILEVEAPIEKQKLFNRVRGSLGVARSGAEIQAHNEWILSKIDHFCTVFGNNEFIWLPGQRPIDWDTYRCNNEKGQRTMSEIPYQEIVVAMKASMRQGEYVSRENLIERVKKAFGLKRTTEKLVTLFGHAIDEAVKEGRVREVAKGKYSL